MKTNFKRYYAVHICDGYVVLDNEENQKIVFGVTKDGKAKDKEEAEQWADNEEHKLNASK
jgi:predicted ABC-type ATPase